MDLIFNYVEGEGYVAEFQATSDFNLHLERKSTGFIVVKQRGTENGSYENAWSKGVLEGAMVIDRDFGALVYPKCIKVVSGSEVVTASVNFNVGGGSGNGSEGQGNIAGEYYALKPVEGFYPYEYNSCVVFLGLLSEVKFGEFNIVYPTARILSSYWYSHQFNSPSAVLGNTTAFCFRPIKRLIEGGDGTLYTFNTLQDALNNEELNEETRNLILASIEPITEEEFYNIEA